MGRVITCEFICAVSLFLHHSHSRNLLSCRATVILSIVFTVFFFMPQIPILPSTIGIPSFVVLSNMTSYVYRNVRFGFYQDYTITTSMIDRALQGSGQSAHPQHAIVLEQPTSMKLEDRGDLEAESLEREI